MPSRTEVPPSQACSWARMLGHVLLSTTQLYTLVSIRKLKQIHTATHPAATLDPERQVAVDDDNDNGASADDVLADLDAEDNNGDPDDDPADDPKTGLSMANNDASG